MAADPKETQRKLDELRKRRRQSVQAEPPLVAGERGDRPPLSYAQQRLWFVEQLDPGSVAYNISTPQRIRGPLDVEALRGAIEDLVHRHESLRTIFPAPEGKPYQRVMPPPTWALPVELARALDFERLSDEEARSPFDLTTGPLLRTRLFRASDDDHLLLVTMHHIVTDGWSMGVFWRELVELYAAHVRGEAATLPTLSVQYADYATWQRTWLEHEGLARELAYWTEQLRSAGDDMRLPFKGARPALESHRGRRVYVELDAEVSGRLRALARREGATLFMTVLAALRALLARYTGQHDLVIGTPIAHRDRPEIEGLIGMFLNTLALRNDVRADDSFTTLLAREKQVALAAYDHQNAPFEMIVDALDLPRRLDRNPVFQVWLVHVDAGFVKAEASGLPLEPLRGDVGTIGTWDQGESRSKFDLSLHTTDDGGAISMSWDYNADLFDPSTIERLVDHYRELLAQVTTAPDTRVGALALTDPAGVLPDPRAPLSDRWDGAVSDAFSHVAAERPGSIAIADARVQWTYAELEARANQLAHYLLAAGCQRGERVAIAAHRSASLAWAVLGILKAGAAFVILDPAYPDARRVAIVEAAKVRALVRVGEGGALPSSIEAWCAAAGLRTDVELPRKSDVGSVFDGFPTTPPAIELCANDIAYVAFTSGTTGRPKGVVGRHGPLSHFHAWRCQAFGLTSGDRFTMLSGLAHDPLHRDLFTPLSLGASLNVIDSDTMTTPGQLAAWLASERITVSHLTPALGRLVTETAADALVIPSLRRIFMVGEALTYRDVDALYRLAPNAECINYYGTTETQQALAYHVVPRASADTAPRRTVIPLGRGAPDVQLLVITPAGRLACINEVGEICVRSPHLAAGYLDDDELTDARFTANPFLPDVPGDRLYRTGDLGRYTPTGEVVFAGRADRQVNVRGFRVELGDIEAALGAHAGVSEAVVTARANDAGETVLVAYVVSPVPLAAALLRAHAAATLPDYMVPSVFVHLERLPLTPNGKLDRKALPAPELATRMEYVAPRDEVEATLARVWTELLGVERIGVHDDFFALGGHSLLAIRLVADVEQKFAVRVPIREVFEHATVEKLAGFIATHAGTAPSERVAFGPSGATEARATSTQEYFWYLDRDDHDPTSYLIVRPQMLHGALDAEVLAQSFREIAATQSIYRTAYRERDGRLVQFVRPASELPIDLDLVDMSSLREDERAGAIAKIAAEQVARGYNLETGEGQLRASLLRFASDCHAFVSVTHHMATDGATAITFNRHLLGGYARLKQGAATALVQPGLQFIDYAHAKERWLASAAGQANEAYWTAYVHGAPTVELEGDFSRGPIDAHRDATRRGLTADLSYPPQMFAMPADIYARVTEAARELRTTPYVVFTSAMAWLVRERSGQDDLAIQSAYSPRGEDRVLEQIHGALSAWTLTRMHLQGCTRLADAVQTVRTAIATVQDHGAPYDYYGIVPHRLRRVVFNYLSGARGSGAGAAPPDYAGVRPEPISWTFPPWKRTWDLHMTMNDYGSGASIAWTGFSGLYKRDTLDALLARFVEILATV